jgi:site-specific recombinase XerD
MIMTDAVEPAPAQTTPAVADLLARARVYVEGSHAKQTLEAYAADWKHFGTWCDKHKRRALPAAPETIICYLVETAERYRVATLDRRLASISYYHKQARHSLPTKDPEVERTMRGIRRAKGMAPNGKTPLLPAQLRQAIDVLPDTLLGKRDHAVLVIGFAGAFRRSELVALTMEDIQTTREGLIVTLRRSKTDQEGQTMVRGLPRGASETTCPVRVLEQWVTAAKITTGPIFRPVNRYGTVSTKALSGLAVPRIVKEALTRAGIDAKDYSGHSLRAGLVTAAAMAGVSERIIILQTGHKNIAVLRRYIREGSVFRKNAAAAVGL